MLLQGKWPIYLFVVTFGTCFSTLNTMLLPFLRSGVECQASRSRSSIGPELGKHELLRRHRKEPPGEPTAAARRRDWTGSARCADKATVLATSQRLDGWCTSLRVLVHMVSTPLLGALADRYGRLRIVLLSVGLTMGSALAFALAASLARLAPHGGGGGGSASGASEVLPLLPLLSGYVLLGCSAVQPPLNAALADRTAPEERGGAFSVLGICHAVSGGLGTLLSILLLRLDLDDYAPVWLLAAAAAPLLALPLSQLGPAAGQSAVYQDLASSPQGGASPESFHRSASEAKQLLLAGDDGLAPPPSPVLGRGPLVGGARATATADATLQDAPPRERAPLTRPPPHAPPPRAPGKAPGGAPGGAPGSALAELRLLAGGLVALLRDSPFLRQLCVGTAALVWGAAGGLSLLSNFTLAVYAWRQGDLQVRWLASVPGALGALGLANGCLFERLGAARVCCAALGAASAGFGLLVLAPLTPLALDGFLALLGFGTVGFAAMLAILAHRFDASEQARAQALLVFSATLARSAAAPSFAHLFDPAARGLAAARPFALALVFVVLGACLLAHAVLKGERDGLSRVSIARLGRIVGHDEQAEQPLQWTAVPATDLHLDRDPTPAAAPQVK